jgi:hypothetical protein
MNGCCEISTQSSKKALPHSISRHRPIVLSVLSAYYLDNSLANYPIGSGQMVVNSSYKRKPPLTFELNPDTEPSHVPCITQ